MSSVTKSSKTNDSAVEDASEFPERKEFRLRKGDKGRIARLMARAGKARGRPYTSESAFIRDRIGLRE